LLALAVQLGVLSLEISLAARSMTWPAVLTYLAAARQWTQSWASAERSSTAIGEGAKHLHNERWGIAPPFFDRLDMSFVVLGIFLTIILIAVERYSRQKVDSSILWRGSVCFFIVAVPLSLAFNLVQDGSQAVSIGFAIIAMPIGEELFRLFSLRHLRVVTVVGAISFGYGWSLVESAMKLSNIELAHNFTLVNVLYAEDIFGLALISLVAVLHIILSLIIMEGINRDLVKRALLLSITVHVAHNYLAITYMDSQAKLAVLLGVEILFLGAVINIFKRANQRGEQPPRELPPHNV
jgi:hypothetical protein